MVTSCTVGAAARSLAPTALRNARHAVNNDRLPTSERSLRISSQKHVLSAAGSRSIFSTRAKLRSCSPSRGWGPSVACASIADNEPQATGTSYEDVGDGRALAVAIAQEADLLKGKDIVVLHVEPLVSWTSYMVLVSTFSRPQMQAVLFKVGKMAMERFGRELPYTKQGSQGRDWECMDFGEVVVQVMTNESRDYYDLESFFAAAEEVELPFEGEVSQNVTDRTSDYTSPAWQKKL